MCASRGMMVLLVKQVHLQKEVGSGNSNDQLDRCATRYDLGKRTR